MKINKENLLKGLKNPIKAIIVVTYPLILRIFNTIINKNKNIIIFGAEYGQGYSGNSRIMYEWMLENRPDIRPTWITKSEEIYRSLKDEKPVVLAHSFTGIITLTRATVVGITHGMSDITYSPDYVSDSTSVVCLRNATGFIWNTEFFKKSDKFEGGKQRRRECDKLIANSEYEVEIETRRLPHDESKYEITGHPRNDVLIDEWEEYRSIYEEEFRNFDNVLLYAPTRRIGYPLPDPVELFPFDDFNEENLLKLLERNNALLLLRPHPRTIEAMKSKTSDDYIKLATNVEKLCENERIRMAAPQELTTLESLIIHVDILITDYSSVINYQIAKGYPVIYIPYDITKWEQKIGIVLESYGSLPGSIANDFDQFTHLVNSYIKNDDNESITSADYTGSFFKHRDGAACERVNGLIEDLR
jgi:CDP-glycerol glycerophosphotransferase (TagB/SpsB family)